MPVKVMSLEEAMAWCTENKPGVSFFSVSGTNTVYNRVKISMVGLPPCEGQTFERAVTAMKETADRIHQAQLRRIENEILQEKEVYA
jgi:hypothetical protein